MSKLQTHMGAEGVGLESLSYVPFEQSSSVVKSFGWASIEFTCGVIAAVIVNWFLGAFAGLMAVLISIGFLLFLESRE